MYRYKVDDYIMTDHGILSSVKKEVREVKGIGPMDGRSWRVWGIFGVRKLERVSWKNSGSCEEWGVWNWAYRGHVGTSKTKCGSWWLKEVEDKITGEEEVNDLMIQVQERWSVWVLKSLRMMTGEVLESDNKLGAESLRNVRKRRGHL